MIRINLMPRSKRQTSEGVGVRVWGTTYLIAGVVWCLALTFVYFSLSSDRDAELAQNAEVQRQIAKVKADSGNLEDLKKTLETSKDLEGVVTALLDARQGPARMLLELSAILSPERGPTIDVARLEEMRKVNPEAGFTPGWDPHRLWLEAFEESGRDCKIKGTARNNEDIAEFMRRLSLSRLFDAVVLVRTGESGSSSKLQTVGFELSCKVRY